MERERAALVLQRLQIRQELGLRLDRRAGSRAAGTVADGAAGGEPAPAEQPARARVAGGSAQAGDLLAAQREALALSDRRDDLQRDHPKARAMLRRWSGRAPTNRYRAAPDRSSIPLRSCARRAIQPAELALCDHAKHGTGGIPRGAVGIAWRLVLGNCL